MKIKNIKKKFNITHYTRAQALKKLQIDPNDFRLLCIFRGIHPKDPNKNQIKTIRKKVRCHNDEDKSIYERSTLLYSVDDINYLLSDKTLQVLRQRKTHNKRINTAKGSLVKLDILQLLDKCPKYPFDEIIRDRYPTFEDALNDLDDALNTLFMVSNTTISDLQRDEFKTDIFSVEMIEEIKIICLQFTLYVRNKRALEKAYCTTRGMFYEATINEIKVKWLCPFESNQCLPEDLDYKILEIYLQFYKSFLEFVNYKLYHDSNMEYPPIFNKELYWNNADIDSLEVVSKPKEAVSKDVEMTTGISENNALDTVEMMDEEQFRRNEERAKTKHLFKDCKIFLSNEIYRSMFKFIITSFGGIVGWDNEIAAGSPFDESDNTITHQLCDRPSIKSGALIGRVYVQPQWILDCINFKKLLPTDKYLVGKALPPHLSPFENYEACDYIPDYYKEINEINTTNYSDGINNAETNEMIKLNEPLLSSRNRKLVNKISQENQEKIEKTKKLQEKKQHLNNETNEEDI